MPTRTGLATANLTLRALNLDSLIAVRPDIAIGLQPQSIAIRQDIQPVHTPLTDDPIAYVTSRADHICTGLSDGTWPTPAVVTSPVSLFV